MESGHLVGVLDDSGRPLAPSVRESSYLLPSLRHDKEIVGIVDFGRGKIPIVCQVLLGSRRRDLSVAGLGLWKSWNGLSVGRPIRQNPFLSG